MVIIGITGTNGAGKGTVVDYLVEKKGFAHYSVRSFLLTEVQKRGLDENRDSLREVANEMRRENHPAYVIEELFTEAKEHGTNAVIESVRTVGEAQFLRAEGAVLFAVDADKRSRYERITNRGSITDQVSFKDFTIQEDREMASEEPWDMNVFGVMRVSDVRIENDGTLEELYQKVDEALASVAAA